MKKSNLKSGFSIYGNKGNVWENNAHIYQSGKGNLCGTPALASNWAKEMKMEEANCEKCNKLYNTLEYKV
jgi:hypothetical protein